VTGALNVAERTRHEALHLPGSAQLLGAAVAGRAALGAGDLHRARVLLERAAEGLSSSHPFGWGYRYRVSQVTALAMSGMIHDAIAALTAMDKVSRRFRALDYEQGLARAWLTANEGVLSEAIVLVDSAAAAARTAGRFAAEVLCLQTATQFGSHSTYPRLLELESIVEGTRVRLATRFARAQCNGDAIELACLSEEFEEMGDLVAAADAAAHAALAYRRDDRRGSALACSTRAEALAERCGGAMTPALRQASQPLPLTGRELEIVMLLVKGLHSRDIAERLTVSTRTIESHLYRAMSKTGTSTREELAALLAPRRPLGR
jgi:DNA-binding CsgD family transcriptional regulator